MAFDIERAKEFYVELLGFEATDYQFGKGSAIVRIGGDRYLGLWEPGEWPSDFLSPERSAGYFGNMVASTHLGFSVHQDDVAHIAERLTGAGYEVDGPMPHGDGSMHLYVLDLDKHAIEFWGRRPEVSD